MAVSSYPVPPPEAVSEMRKNLFSNRFVDEHLSALLGRASYAMEPSHYEEVPRQVAEEIVAKTSAANA